MGIYNLNDHVYESLARVLNYLETMSTTQTNVHFETKIMEDLMRQVTSRAHFNSMIAYITRQTKELVQGNV